MQIETVTEQTTEFVLEQARTLFRAYGEFLREAGGPALLCFSRLDEEIATLPSPYTTRGGEVLLATEGSSAAGCIAYRALAGSNHPKPCEIKRLFVGPAFRGQGLGKQLITSALAHARVAGYETACLDTEPRSMVAAKQMYLELGFVEDHERNSASGENIVIYFQKSLLPEAR